MTKEEKIAFFIYDVPNLLSELHEDTAPIWGSMTAVQMVDHLTSGLRLSQRRDDFEIVTPAEVLPKYKAFLMSDKPLPHHAVKPEGYALFESDEDRSVIQVKNELLAEIPKFIEDLNEEGYRSVHRDFGVMTAEESLQLHYKHFIHHFRQFGRIALPE